MYTKRAELKAGLVVVAALAALLFFLYFAGGQVKPWAKHEYWNLRLEQGRNAPRPGDPVQMNGYIVGQVERVEQAEETRRGTELTAADREALGLAPDAEPGTAEAREVFVRVVVRTSPGQTIPRGTTAEIVTNIAGVRSMHLVPGRFPQNLTPADTQREPILAREAAGLETVAQKLDAALVEIESAAKSIDELATKAVEVLGEVSGVVSAFEGKVQALDTAAMSDAVLAGIDEFRQAMSNLESRLPAVLDSFAKAGEGADGLMTEARAALGVVRADIETALEAANRAFASMESTAVRLEGVVERSGPQVEAFLSEMVASAEGFRAFSSDLQAMGPDVRAVVAKAGGDMDALGETLKDTANNLYDASEAIRANPARLLSEPEPGETAYEELRLASLAYMRSMRMLAAANERMEQALARGAHGEGDAADLVQDALESFRTALGAYERDQSRWRALFQGQTTSAR